MLLGTRDVSGAIFDFDGTLADSMWVWDDVDRQFFERRGLPVDDDAIDTIAVLGFENGADFVIEHYALDERPEDIIEEWKALALDGYAHHVQLKAGAREFLDACAAQGLPCAIATTLQRTLLEPALTHNGIAESFDALCICDELQCGGKSSSAVYEHAARCIGTELGRCVVFEDVAMAARSAKQGGAYVVGMYDGHKQQDSEQLATIADVFAHSWSELLPINNAGRKL